MMQLANLRENDATGERLEPEPSLRRVGTQGAAPSLSKRGQAPRGWRPAFLPRAFRDLFDVNDNNDIVNARSNLVMQLELRNQCRSTILE